MTRLGGLSQWWGERSDAVFFAAEREQAFPSLPPFHLARRGFSLGDFHQELFDMR
jgi:hypothetical protein